MRLTASELHARGAAAANARRFAAARRDLAEAAMRASDDDLRARVDGTRAYVLAQTGHPADAEQLVRDALARRGLATATSALLTGQLGTLLVHAGRLDESVELLSSAISATSGIELANLLLNRAVARMQRQELADCIEDLDRAVAIYDDLGAEEPLAEARHNRGYAALLGGDLVTALALMTRSRPMLAATSSLAAAIGDQDRAEVLRDAGLVEEAERLLADVATQFGAQRMPQARAEAELHLARSLLWHDAPAAERTASVAARRFEALGNRAWAARARALRLEARVQRQLPARAEEFADTASALRRSGLRTEAAALVLTGRLAIGGRLPRPPADAAMPLRLRWHEVRAARALRAGRTRDTLRIAADGLDLLSAWQRSFGALDLQASVTMHGRDLMFAGLAAAVRTDDAATIFDWSERARHLSQQVSPVRAPDDDDLAADLARLRMLRAELSGQDWTDDPAVRAIRDRVRERQWSSTGVAHTHERVPLAEVQGRIDASTAVVAYVFTGSALQCIVVTRSDARTVRLDWPRIADALTGLRADLDMAALTGGGPMGTVVARSLDDRLARVDAELLAPFREQLDGTHRIVLTTPGALAGIPWALLPTMTGRPFTLATSVSRWLTAPAPTRRARAGFAAGPRVPRADEEIRRAASAWAAPEVLSSPAEVADVTALAARSDVVHVAAHGRHSADNPLFSGLEFADGILFGHDVDLIARPPETVILSACELGRSSVRWGEESLGMTRVWLHAGTRCVLAAPVSVADDDACELLASVHEGLARGDDPADALVAAAEHTGVRAPFQCHGNGF
ncbi:CHAT domain-containing protein [Microbacterium sp. ZW T5_45]|uniref:CHAT domain-containing protein n=1 Tax=Microbacterium sp. ZW T5_45 TaxID=3378080 RepID=UPI003854F86F